MWRNGAQIFVKSKMLVLATSEVAQNNPHSFYFMTHWVLFNFFPNLGVKGLLNFDKGPQWCSETCRSRAEISVESKVLVVATSYTP